MAQQSHSKTEVPEAGELYRRWFELGQRSLNAFGQVVKHEVESDQFRVPDPLIISKLFMDWGMKAMARPDALMQAQLELYQSYAALWQAATGGKLGPEGEALAVPEKGDRRFSDDSWDNEVAFNFVKQAYLLTSQWIQSSMRKVDGLDDKTQKKVDFYTRLFVDALAPSNFVMTNPKVLRTTMESGGENLLNGLENLLDDLERGKGRLDIAMTDYKRFKLGENVASTPGKVVYQNELMQLLQYEPSTEKVYRRPLLIVPPWINKFYILDLQPRNSFIKWAVDQGHSVFVISWINPDERLAHKTFEDYMTDGTLSAMDAIERATGEREANVIGYCIGGTLTATTLAYLAEQGDERVKSATYFTSMLDFSEPGELGIFLDEELLDSLEAHMERKGFLEGHHMMTVFNLMRDNDLIWSFVVNNYLLGRQPFPFDLLYWNSDSTRMPAAMHKYYLRNMYQENRLVQPGGIEVRGVPIDLGKIEVPSYFLSTLEDHIAPWKSTYMGTQVLSGRVKFVLAASGHIAGVINPPVAKKYGYWTNAKTPADPEAWFRGSKQHEGSWWDDWGQWVGSRGGGQVPARKPGDGALEVLEDAPGSYVKMRLGE